MSFRGLGARFFLALNNTLLSGCVTGDLPTHLLKDTWVAPSFGNYELSRYKHPCAGFRVDTNFQLLRVNTKEHDSWIIYMVRIWFCKKLPNCLPKRLYHSACPPATSGGPVAPHPRRHLVPSVFWTLAILIGVWWCFLVAFICISLVTDDVQHLFICVICHLYIFFGEMSVKVFGFFF